MEHETWDMRQGQETGSIQQWSEAKALHREGFNFLILYNIICATGRQEWKLSNLYKFEALMSRNQNYFVRPSRSTVHAVPGFFGKWKQAWITDFAASVPSTVARTGLKMGWRVFKRLVRWFSKSTILAWMPPWSYQHLASRAPLGG